MQKTDVDSSDMDKWEDILRDIQQQLMINCPNSVVDEHWGEYADAESFCRRLQPPGCFQEVFANRSLLTFVNGAGLRFLLPIWMIHSVHENIIEDEIAERVLQVLVSGHVWNTDPRQGVYTRKQMNVMIRWTRCVRSLMIAAGISDVLLADQALELLDLAIGAMENEKGGD